MKKMFAYISILALLVFLTGCATPLIQVVEKGDINGVKTLLDQGADVNESEEISGLYIAVKAASGGKCDRCWIRSTSVGVHPAHPEICTRCHDVVNSMNLQPEIEK